MKAFLEIWNREFARAVSGRLGQEAGEIVWSPADELPAAQDVLVVAMRWEGMGVWQGSVTLLASRSEVAALLTGADSPTIEARKPAKKKGASGAGQEAAEHGAAEGDALPAQWAEWLQEVLAAMPLPEPPGQVELSVRPQGVPLTPYVLRAGRLSVRMAMICDLTGKAPAGMPESSSAAESKEVQAGQKPGVGAAAHAASGPAASQANLDLLLDIEVDASLRFGSRELAIRELLDTGPGDVLELDRHITDPVDLVVGDKIVARGEVVLVNGNFGLRVIEVAEPKKCLESVRCLF